MDCRCGHSGQEHPTTHPCAGQIHYPSEDYPCTCEDFETGETEGKCATCDHKRELHEPRRRCARPDCPCRNFEP